MIFNIRSSYHLIALGFGLSIVWGDTALAQQTKAEGAPEGFAQLFNGDDLTGWEGNLDFFRVEEGAIVAGRLTEAIPQSEFLCTKREYGDFELRLQVKDTEASIEGSKEAHVKGAVVVRSRRLPDDNAVRGYLVDTGTISTEMILRFEGFVPEEVAQGAGLTDQPMANIWGALIDESRRGKMLALGRQDGLGEAIKSGGWNDLLIRCEGSRIQVWVNGFQTVDYTEPDDTIARAGIIGLKFHGGSPTEYYYRNIVIKELKKSGGEESVHQPERAVSNLKLYPGVEATLFASEPMILNPTNIDIDHRGRVWMCEVVNYPSFDGISVSGSDFDGRPEGDRILILEDTTGDGVADKRTVYYQGRDVDTAMGIAVLGNKVIVTRAPNVLVFTDEDGDDKPDKKEYLFTKTGGPQGDHSTHAFQFGPDGKLYWNMGNAGRHIHDKDGNLVYDMAGNPVIQASRVRRNPEEYGNLEAPYRGGMVFRCNPDGSEFEVLGHNFRNNYDVTVDSLGGLWQSDNDVCGNFSSRMNYVMEFGNYGFLDELTGADFNVGRTGMSEEIPKRHWHQNDPGVVPNLHVTGTGSPTGVIAYEGRLLPEKFWDQVLFCDHGPGVVWSPIATKEGAGYVPELTTLMMGDRVKWVRPVDAAVAPDGAVFVSDWYDPVTSWNLMYDVDRGRIFRLAPPGNRPHVPEFDFDSPEGAVEALKSPNYSARYMAWTALHEMQEEAEPALLDLFTTSDRTRHRARALWLLSKIDGRGEHHIDMASRDDEEDVRVVSIRAARQLKIDAVPLLKRLAMDPSPQVRRECAIALRYHESPEAPAVWAELAARHDGRDRWYVEALGIGADGQWDAYLAAWLNKVSPDWNTPAGRDILWRSRGEVTPEYLTKIINSPDVDLDGTKRYLRAFDFQEESEARTESLRELALDMPVDDQQAAFAASEALLRIKNFDVDAEPEMRRRINEILARIEGTEQFAELVLRFELREHYQGLMTVAVQNSNNPRGIASVKALLRSGETSIVSDIIASEDIDTALKTVVLLGNAMEEQANQLLVQTLQNEALHWRVREQAVRSLVPYREWDGDGTGVLVALAKAGEFPADLKEVAGAAIARSTHMWAQDAAKAYFPMPPMKNDEELPHMMVLLNTIGDAERGKAAFTQQECNKCHIINGEGTNFGPDLSQIGIKLSKTGLYDSILDPSATVPPEYKLHLLTLKDGQQLSGLLISETADKITLRLDGGAVTEYAPDEVAEKRESLLSPMPADLQRQIGVAELVDLVEYLTSLR
jgi:putative membrane-bound dehydrogenase-like protein